MLDLPTMIDIAHRHNLPLMVDAAAEEDFRKYIAMGEMCIRDRICVEDGIDSSKDSGKLMISVLSAVAEICLLYTSIDSAIIPSV